MIGINNTSLYRGIVKLKNFKNNVSVIPFATKAHLNNEMAGGLNVRLRNIMSHPEEYTDVGKEIIKRKANQFDNQFRNLIPTFWKKKYYRGICNLEKNTLEMLKNAKVGDTVVPDNGFAYISKSKQTARDYSSYISGKSDDTCVFMTINVPAFSKISRIPWFLKQALLPKGAEYKVVSKEVEKSGLLNLVLEYIPKK